MIKFITLFLLLFVSDLSAVTPVSGTFEATQACPAYLSKNRKTNPDNLVVQPHQQYQLKEINKSPPDWLRIEIAEQHYTLRWVKASCGITEYNERSSEGCKNNPGMADAHVLALSSQPGFCQTYGYEKGKPECANLSSSSYQANHLTLHGLWPNQESCGQNYGFCGVSPQSKHCDYTPLKLSASVAENLRKYMPSYNYGSCLERHEWYKHGSCQILSSDDYFALAMRLTKEMNQTPFGQYLTAHRGEVVQLSSLRELIEQSFGSSNADKVSLTCKNGILVDVYLQLPALIPFNEPLGALLNKATASHSHDLCYNNVTISDFNKESWL